MASEFEILDQELNQILKLLGSPDWVVWVNFLKKQRRPGLQQKINASVRKGDFHQAQIEMALMDDCQRQIESFERYIKNLKEKKREKST